MKYRSVVVEVARQAGVLGYCVFVDSLWDTDLRPVKTSRAALRKARAKYAQSGTLRSEPDSLGQQRIYRYASNQPAA